MPGRTRKTTTIDSEELEAFRATLPDYRRYETSRFLTVHWDIVRAL